MAKISNSTGTSFRHRACALLLAVSTAFSPVIAAAAPPTIPGFYGAVPMPGAPAAGTLPVVRPGSTPIGATVEDRVGNTLTINQTRAQATIDWKSFNIAADSVVLFNQKKDGVAQPQWVALNRIYDANPSLIFGNLKADGKIYLINRNGILFGPGSQVDVHAMIASNLNLTDANFENGKLRFGTDPYDPAQGALSNDAYVSNYGDITTGSGGSVFFVGPNVVNAGTISSPSGKINLIGIRGAGEVETAELTVDATGNDVTYSDLLVPGAAYNAQGGQLITEGGGRIGMYGATVQNDGLIRAVTAFKKGGVVILAARDKVTTGVGSVIESPIDKRAETADPAFIFNAPEVIFKGLNTDSGINPLSLIEHQGAIVAPSGNVSLTARDRIFLAEGSSINVAGLWLDRAASANLMEAQLNSVDLRDYYGQKDGTLLGEKIYLDVLTGSGIGNLKNNYLTLQTGAEERSTSGGRITFSELTDDVALGELIIKQGALLDFSGGGIRYGTGTMATSRLVSGNKLYDIGSAPQWVSYDRLADSQTKSYQRFGVTQEFKGLYFGGGSSLQDLSAGRVVGSDAGSVVFNARVAALDGTLLSEVTRGQYQTNVTSHTATDSSNYLISVTRGLEEPVGGTVTVGNLQPAAPAAQNSDNEKDFIVNSIAVSSTTTPLAADFGADSVLDRETTQISAALLNSAGLSSLNLFANTSITTEQGADLTLLSGGSYTARGRRIDFAGTIDVPGGSVEMTTRPNVSSYESLRSKTGVNALYQPLIETVYLASGSVISTAGEQIDNSAAGMALHPITTSNHTNGGTILIQERTEEGTGKYLGSSPEGHSLVLAAGALLDVSGGWLIDAKGKITGGDAGTLELKGPTLSLAGEVRGYSLPGKTGGEIRLHAGEVLVTSRDLVLPSNVPIDATVPEYLRGKLVLGEGRLQETGFSRISLTAINDISFSDGAVLTPSLTKLPMPVPAIVSQSAATGNRVLPAGSDPTVADYLGSTAVTVTAGKNIYENSPFGTGGDSTNSTIAKIELAAGTGITVAPGGTVELTAAYLDIAGRIEALGGNVTAKSEISLTVKTGAEILAGGYNKPVSTLVAGQPAGSSPQQGGKVTLASTGDVVLEAGSLVDVSGSASVQRLLAGTDGKPVAVAVAADPGTLSLSYSGTLTLDGQIDGRAQMAGGRGGNLSVTNSTDNLNMLEQDINRYQSSGFDALTFASTLGSLVLPEHLDVAIGRSLTLDSGSIKGVAGGDVTLRAPWITVTNTPVTSKDPSSGAAAPASSGSLSLLADGFLDLQGSVTLNNFGEVTLQAGRDLRLSDLFYTKTSAFAGNLAIGGNLTLQGSRVYPTTLTGFTITAPGKVTILPGAVSDPNPIYSAGGSLTIVADGGIEQRGTLAAPQGSITLDGRAEGRVLLAQGSSTSTAGSVAVQYGSYNGSTWTTRSETLIDGSVSNFGAEIASAPTNSITLKGKEVIVDQGAGLDISGGGSVYSESFQSGIPGTLNPLTLVDTATARIKIDPATNKPLPTRYVILPDRSVTLPGAAVYLEAAPEFGLAAGIYSLLPADQYSLVPGALVIQDAGLQLVAGQRVLSAQGYQVVAGYGTVMDTAVSSQAYKGYSIRTAAEVRVEGDFTARKEFTSGNGGNLTLTASSAVLNGDLNARPLQDPTKDYLGGVLTLSAKNVIAQNGAAALPAGFSFDDSLPAALADTLIVDTAAVSNQGVRELALGSKEFDSKTGSYTYNAETVTVKSGSTLQAPSVTLQAKNAVTVETGAVVDATGDGSGGIVTVDVPTGVFNLNQDALVHAVNGLGFDVGSMSLLGDFQADHSSFSLTANNIVFANDSYLPATDASGVPQNVYLTEKRWTSLAEEYDDLALKSRGDMIFQRDVAMSAIGALTLDAGRYTTASDVDVAFSAGGKLTLLNSGAAPTSQGVTNNSTLSFKAAAIDLTPGGKGLVLDQFRTVTLESATDLTLRGTGTVKVARDLNLIAPRVTTSYYQYDADPADKADRSIPYTAAGITLDARDGHVSIAGNGKAKGETVTPGGSLEIMGASITVGDTDAKEGDVKYYDTVLQASSGQVKLTATGDIAVTENSSILATGSKGPAPMQTGIFSYSPGGSITVQSSAGAVNLARGSTLDVSALEKGDAGAITLSADSGGVTMSGTVKGFSANGKGGSFALDSATLAGVGGLDGVSTKLAAGGFDDLINVRSRSGDLTLAADSTLTGREVVIAADGGAIDLYGKIKADGVTAGETGGRVELYAGTALTLESGSAISAKGTAGAVGGTVALSATAADKIAGNAALQVLSGAVTDVSGGAGGKGGSVSLRAYQIGENDANMASLPGGAIVGASRVSAEVAKKREVSGNMGALPANAVMNDANLALLKGALFEKVEGAELANYHLQAGLEVASAAGTDLILDTAWDLSQLRPGGEAGVVTLRAGKDLIINQNLVDAPSARGALYSTSMLDSWGINLVAGAEATAANYKAASTGTALAAGTGTLGIAVNKAVYSENAAVSFAAGNNMVLGGWSATGGPGYMINGAMQYNLGSYGGTVRGQVGNNLTLSSSGSAIQTALGDIDIRVGGNLDLGSNSNSVNAGAIRTTGEYTTSSVERMPGLGQFMDADATSYWTYHNGGDISLDVGGNVAGNLNKANGWDGAYVDPALAAATSATKLSYPWYLAAGFGGSEIESISKHPTAVLPVTVGIATMGGGDISVRTGGSLITQIGAFGTRDTGNLVVTSGGDMTGRFRVMNGTAALTSGGGFGKDDNLNATWKSVLEMADAQVSVAAQGDVHLGAVINPDNSRDRIFFGSNPRNWNMSYAKDAGVSVSSLQGDLSIYGSNGFNAYNGVGSSTQLRLADRQRVLPASVALSAEGDLAIRNNFYLAPSSAGNLELYAGGNLSGAYATAGTAGGTTLDTGSIRMKDADVDSFYGRQPDTGNERTALLNADPGSTDTDKSKVVNHRDDPVPVVVKAGGDIDTLKLVLNKKAEITAGGDIKMLDFIGQNTSPDSVTLISAKGSLDQGILVNNLSQIKVGGPGTLLVEVGTDLNLGNSKGIESIGNSFNSGFTGGDTDSSLIVSAGAEAPLLPTAGAATSLVSGYFEILRQAGKDYSELKRDGKNDEALQRIEDARAEVSKYFKERDGAAGSITMVDSLIRSKKGDIYLMARGDVNVGRSNVSDSGQGKKDTGITTTFGGDLSIFTGGDLNVNESRTMTFMGGDIVIWSNQGDINAGRGSKTALSSGGLPVEIKDDNGVLIGLLYPAPSVGSGVRASTYDADGTTGPRTAPDPGDIYLFAPKGIIDAGEAGIAGGNIVLGATEVRNAVNISFSGASVGVPTSSDSSISLGALGGNSNLTDSSKMMEQASSLGAAKEKTAQQTGAVDDFMSKWLDLRIISFEGDVQESPADEEARREKEKSRRQEK